MKQISLILSLLISCQLYAQLKTYQKAEMAFNTGNFKGANKQIDKCLSNDETKDNPNTLILKSKIMFELSKDHSNDKKFPSAFKDALKYAEKAVSENKNLSAANAFKETHVLYLNELLKQNNKEAILSYNQKKYAKALPLFKRSLFFGLDTQALVLAADCYWNLSQKDESLPMFKKAAEIIYAAVLDSQTKIQGYHKEPFRKLGKYYIDQEAYDTAYIIVKNGREILPFDPILNSYTYQLMRYALDKIPPSEDYLQMV
jgi:tetratricopeptide (TPR) repeat protein